MGETYSSDVSSSVQGSESEVKSDAAYWTSLQRRGRGLKELVVSDDGRGRFELHFSIWSVGDRRERLFSDGGCARHC